MNNNPTITPQVVPSPFHNFCMSIGALPTSYKDTLDYYETLLWLIKFLDTQVLPALNTNGEAVSELQGLYIQLKDYVNNYFDNLDVQEEINNKLDEMAEDGILQEIVAAYLDTKAVFAYDSVSDMKEATNLINGSYTQTLGYYSVNDGGGATYKVRTITNDDIVDEKLIIALHDDSLIAELIIKDSTINIKQFGAYGDNLHDDTQAIQSALNTNLQILIPEGIFLISTLGFKSNQKIYGTSRNLSILKSIANNTNTNLLHNASPNSVMFQLDNFKIDGNASNNNTVIDGIFIDNGASDAHANIDNLRIVDCTGNGIHITHIRELRIDKCSVWRNHLNGIYFDSDATDSSINSTVCHTNYQHGIKISAGANRFNDTKCFYNGYVSLPYGSVDYSEQMSGWYCSGIKNVFVNCQSQENFGDGFIFYHNSRIDAIGLNVDNNGLKYENGSVVGVPSESAIYSGVRLIQVYQSNFNLIAGNFRTYLTNPSASQAYALYMDDITEGDKTQQINAVIESLEPVVNHVYIGNARRLTINVNSRYFYDRENNEYDITYSNGFAPATNFPLKLQRFGGLVVLNGVITSSDDFPNSATTCFNIPDDCRPAGNALVLSAEGKTNEWGDPISQPFVRVFGSTGNVQINNVGNTAGVKAVQINGVWLAKN